MSEDTPRRLDDPDHGIDPNLDAELFQLFAEEKSGADEDPSADSPSHRELQDLVAGRLEGPAEEALLERIALDAAATDRLLALRRLAAGDSPARPGEADEKFIDAVMARIEPEDELPAGVTPLATPARRTRPMPRWLPLAALVLLSFSALFAASTWRDNQQLLDRISRLEGEIRDLDGARPGSSIIDLFNASHLRGESGEGAAPTWQLAPGDSATLILTPSDPVPSREYFLVISRGDSQVWQGAASAEASGAVTLILGPRLLRPGRFKLELQARPDPGQPRPPEEIFFLEIEPKV